MTKPLDLTGQRFGRWLVLKEADGRPKGRRRWECRCDCGTVSIVEQGNLRHSISRSCGCFRSETTTARKTTHGHTTGSKKGTPITPEYSAWVAMKQRCLNPNDPTYPRWGGRGITVCERWLHNYPAFLADVGPRPTAEHSIDRIDVNGPYEPGNVRWASKNEQAGNKRKTLRITIGGRTESSAEWERILGLRPNTIYQRVVRGWSPEKAATTPVIARQKKSST